MIEIPNDLTSILAEIDAALETLTAPITEVASTLQEYWKAAEARLVELRRYVQTGAWDERGALSVVGVLRLAEVGWTVPSWLTPRQVVELSGFGPAAADAWFTKLYLGPEDGLTRVAAELDNLRMAKWRSLLEQTCSAIRRGEHLIAVPSLLLMIEGFVAQSACGPTKVTNLPRLLRQAEPPEQTPTITLIWESTGLFFARLFGRSDFTAGGPSFLNRHWILHGRCAADWSIADAIRLLNALSTLDWLMEFAESFAAPHES